MRCYVFLSYLAVFLVASASATTYIVYPDGTGDFPTIQEAIWATVDNDTILLADGVFTGWLNRNLDYGGRLITLESVSGDPESCVIDCEGTPEEIRRGFLFHSGEGPDAVLRGVTIAHGMAAAG